MKKALAPGVALATIVLLLSGTASMASAADALPPEDASSRTVQDIVVPEGATEFEGWYGHTVTCDPAADGSLATNVRVTYESLADGSYGVADVQCVYPAVGEPHTKADDAEVIPVKLSEQIPLSFGLHTATGQFGDVVSCRADFASFPTEVLINYESTGVEGEYRVVNYDCLSPNGAPISARTETIPLIGGTLTAEGTYGDVFDCSVNENGVNPTSIAVQYVSWTDPAVFEVAWRDCLYTTAPTPVEGTPETVAPPAAVNEGAEQPVASEEAEAEISTVDGEMVYFAGSVTVTGKYGQTIECPANDAGSNAYRALVKYSSTDGAEWTVASTDCDYPQAEGVAYASTHETVTFPEGVTAVQGKYGHAIECEANVAGAVATAASVQYASYRQPAAGDTEVTEWEVASVDCSYPAAAEQPTITPAPTEAPAAPVAAPVTAEAKEVVKADTAPEVADKQEAGQTSNSLPRAGGDQSVLLLALSAASLIGLAAVVGFILSRRNRKS